MLLFTIVTCTESYASEMHERETDGVNHVPCLDPRRTHGRMNTYSTVAIMAVKHAINGSPDRPSEEANDLVFAIQ